MQNVCVCRSIMYVCFHISVYFRYMIRYETLFDCLWSEYTFTWLIVNSIRCEWQLIRMHDSLRCTHVSVWFHKCSNVKGFGDGRFTEFLEWMRGYENDERNSSIINTIVNRVSIYFEHYLCCILHVVTCKHFVYCAIFVHVAFWHYNNCIN